jgi:hypothetical protein
MDHGTWIPGWRSDRASIAGHSHYLQLGGDTRVYLYGSDIPDWLMTLTTDARFVRRGHGLLSDENNGVEDSEFSLSDNPDEELAVSPWRWPIKMSSAERAILELLEELPKNESFHSIDMVFEGMVNLRPKMLTTLLTRCRSVKVKRLFFVYADKHAHAWLKHIDRSQIDMGRGDRALVPGGRLHPIYRITVPADLVPKENMDARDRYMRQVELLVQALPYIARQDVFALKGATAINLFYRNMPRLSVDIDLT